MMLYLTGADTSLFKSSIAPQNDSYKSLGGYVSSTPVPNSEINSLFDLISAYTLEKKKKETIAIALINKLEQSVTDVTLKIVTKKDNLATFKIAAVPLNDSFAMEKIRNRYSEPIYADFYNADFQRASVDLKILNPASVGEEIVLFPFNISFTVLESGIEGTWSAFENAFEKDSIYKIERISEIIFRISRRDETVLETSINCSYLTTVSFTAEFLSDLKNEVTNEVTLVEKDRKLLPNKGIGLWLQRDLKSYNYPTNEKLIDDYKNNIIKNNLEEIELIINYNLVENDNYSNSYNQETYA